MHILESPSRSLQQRSKLRHSKTALPKCCFFVEMIVRGYTKVEIGKLKVELAGDQWTPPTTIHYSLFTIHYSLFTIRYYLFTDSLISGTIFLLVPV